MTISSVLNYVPTVRIASSEQMTRNLKKIAVPSIILSGAVMIQEVEAVTMAECFQNCDRHRDADALSKLVCYALCAIFSKG